jgi:superoxide dismutase, Cu-Zn family
MSILQQKRKTIIAGLGLGLTVIAHADTITSEIYTTKGTSVGTIVFEDNKYGLLIKPQLSGLPAGIHGFHIHQHPDCGNHAMNAGAHLDPAATNSHQGPYGEGHLGDLPVLAVASTGATNTPVLAPRLKTKDIRGHSIMVHTGGDNYSDNPPLGGGGERIACGKIP